MSEAETKFELTAAQQRTMVRAVALAEEELRRAKTIVEEVFRDLAPRESGPMVLEVAKFIATNYGHVLTEKS